MDEIRLGNITGSHGLKGWVSVYSFTDPAQGILTYSPWTLRCGVEKQEVRVRAHRTLGKRLLALFEGVGGRDQADGLKGYEILVRRDRLQALGDGEFYWFQLEGLGVRNKDRVLLGIVDHLIRTGANDVLALRPGKGSVDEAERLIPYVEGDVVLQVDPAVGEILVDWEIDY